MLVKINGDIHPELKLLSELVSMKQQEIGEWINKYCEKKPYLLYNSVDVRCSGFKVAPVDTNIFPAGFHLLSSLDLEKARQSLKTYLDLYFPAAGKFLIIPENFTRNTNYLANLLALQQLFIDSGFQTCIGSPFIQQTLAIRVGEQEVIMEPISREENQVYLKGIGYKPDVLVLNNDLTSGIPEILAGISQPVIPGIEHGWYVRRKYNHFKHYNYLVKNFAKEFSIDPWLLSTKIIDYQGVDFKEKIGVEEVQSKVEKVLQLVKKKYREYKINEEPYAFVKADNGTFGMGITNTKDTASILTLNKRQRHSIAAVKGSVANSTVIIQEGVPTCLELQGSPAESMWYYINSEAVSRIFRYNGLKDCFSNLNSTGVSFENQGEEKTPFYLLEKLVSKLALLATLYEIEDHIL